MDKNNGIDLTPVLVLITAAFVSSAFYAISLEANKEAELLRQQLKEQQAEMRGMERGVVFSR